MMHATSAPATRVDLDPEVRRDPTPTLLDLVPRSALLAATFALSCILPFGIFGFGAQAVIAAFAAGVLVILAGIDVAHRLLPNRLVLPAYVLVLAAQLAVFPDEAPAWLLAGPAAAAFLALPLLFRRDAMGMGDIKLALLLGAAIGWNVFAAIVIGSLVMVPFAVAMLLRDRTIRGATLPFGPFLAFGTVVLLFAS